MRSGYRNRISSVGRSEVARVILSATSAAYYGRNLGVIRPITDMHALMTR